MKECWHLRVKGCGGLQIKRTHSPSVTTKQMRDKSTPFLIKLIVVTFQNAKYILKKLPEGEGKTKVTNEGKAGINFARYYEWKWMMKATDSTMYERIIQHDKLEFIHKVQKMVQCSKSFDLVNLAISNNYMITPTECTQFMTNPMSFMMRKSNNWKAPPLNIK